MPVVAVHTRNVARPAPWKAASRKQHPQQRRQQRTMVVKAEAGSSLPKRESSSVSDEIAMNVAPQHSRGAARLRPRWVDSCCRRHLPAEPLLPVPLSGLSPSGSAGATLADKRSLLDKVDCFIFDCDGVIWRGDSVIEGVPATLDMLRDMVGRGCCPELVGPCRLHPPLAQAPQSCRTLHAACSSRRLWLGPMSGALPPDARTLHCWCNNPPPASRPPAPMPCPAGQAAGVRDQQLHQEPRRLPEEVHRAGAERQGRGDLLVVLCRRRLP